MRRIQWNKSYAVILIFLWFCFFLWGNGTMEARFTDFDEVICRFSMDTEPPELYITDPVGSSVETASIVNRTSCTVTGTVADEGGVKRLTVNGQEVAVDENGTWNTVLTLIPDSLTEIIVTATDMAGNTSSQTCYVRHESKAYALYSSTDRSLTFVRAADPIQRGTYLDGKYINAVYTGFETAKYTSYSRVPWTSYRTSIQHVIVRDPIRPLYTAYWFYGFQNCLDMELRKLDTSKVTDMQSMFNSCRSLTSLDLSCMDTTAPGNRVSNMFFSNNLLAEITLGEKCNVRYPFPTPSPTYIEGADGKWYDTETGIGYLPANVPKNVKATYVAVKPSGQFPPYLSVSTPTGTSEAEPMYIAQSQCLVEGIALDDTGAVTLTVNGSTVEVEENGAWSTEMTLPYEQITAVTVVATDQEGLSTTEIRYVCSSARKVYFDANGGNFVAGNVNVVSYFDAEDLFTGIVEGTYQEPVHGIWEMVFDGWYITKEGQPGTEFDLSVESREITVYARWKDAVPPILEVIDPTSQDSGQPTLTGQGAYVVRGTASDGGGLAAVTVNGKDALLSEDGSWSLEVNLEKDVVTTLSVVATDHYGNITTKTCYITYDESGPLLTMSAPAGLTELSPTYCGNSQYVATGTAKDSAGIKTLKVNKELGELDPAGVWSYELSLEKDQVTQVTVWAEDILGKSSSLSRYVYYDSQSPNLQIPDLAESSLNDPVQVPASEYLLVGTVSDTGSGVDRVQINGVTVAVDDQGNWQYPVELPGGTTVELVVKAIDLVGNESQKTYFLRYDGFTVIYDANGGAFVDGSILRELTYYQYAEEVVPAHPETYEEPTWEPAGNGDWGYLFAGWYTSPECETDQVFDEGMAQPGMTVYAKWEPRPRVAITYHANGGSFEGSDSNLVSYVWAQECMQVAEGEYRIPEPSASCWQFDGWYTSSFGETGTEFVLSQQTQNSTVYAKWKDIEAPEIQITSPNETTAASPQRTGQSFWMMEGIVTDRGRGVREVTVQGEVVDVDVQGNWSSQVNLTADNINTIVVTAVDMDGNSTTERAYVYCDQTYPVLTVITPAGRTEDDPTYAVTPSYLVTGTVSDDDEIAQVLVNGIEAQRQDSGSWWCAVTLEDGVTQKVEVVAQDRSGNVVTEQRYVRYDSQIHFETFTVTIGNRHKIGYMTGMTDLEIPETFFDEETNTWYHVVAIGFQEGDSTSVERGAFANETDLTRVIIPGSVKLIQRYSFYDATGITQLSLGYGIEEIDLAVFHGCNGLIEVSLPDSITILGSGAFMMSEQLKKTNLPKGLSEVYPDVFGYCYQLEGQMVIPQGVQKIGNGAFLDTQITSLVIPVSVKTVGDNAFRACDKLTDVYYEGTQEQWDAITFGKNNSLLLQAKIHYENTEELKHE